MFSEYQLPEQGTAQAPLTVGITGASGYVGGLIADEFSRHGDHVVELGRRPRSASSDFRPFALDKPLENGILEGLDVLVHAAYDLELRSRREIWSTNVGGARMLSEQASMASVGSTILVSSMSAYEGTKQIYGQAKLSCEHLFCRRGGVAVRLGLVCSEAGGGMIGSLRKLARLPVVPLPGPGTYQYTVDASQVGPAIRAVAVCPFLSGEVIGLAHPCPVEFRDILVALAPPSRRPRTIEIPWQLIYSAMRYAERCGIALPLRADSMLGLVAPALTVANVATWSRLGIELRPLALGMAQAQLNY